MPLPRPRSEVISRPVHAKLRFPKPSQRLLPLLRASAGRTQTGSVGSMEAIMAAPGIRLPNGAVTGDSDFMA